MPRDKRPPLRMQARVAESTGKMDGLALLAIDWSAAGIRIGLANAGFKPGDVVDIILAERRGQ